MSDQTIPVTELDVRRARLLATLAKHLGRTPPASVLKVAKVQLPSPLNSPATGLAPGASDRVAGRGSGGGLG